MKIQNYEIRKINGEYANLSLGMPEAEEEKNASFLKDKILQNIGIIYDYSEIYPNKVFTDKIKISSDILFCNEIGTIIKIYKKRSSVFNNSISGYQTKYIIQLANGECDRLGLNIGDILIYNQDILKTPDFINGLFYTNGEEYFCKSLNGIYYYSYISHLWEGPVNESNEWLFFQRYLALNNNKKNILTADLAKEECIKKDLNLLEDFKLNQAYYYKLSAELFVKQIPHSGVIQYYKYKKGWVKFIVSDENYKIFLDNLTLISFVKLKTEVDKEIESIERIHKKKELDEINIKNTIQLKNIPLFYSYQYVFYKDDYKEGWKLAILPGSTLLAEYQCSKYKIEKNWKDYEVFDAGITRKKPKPNWNPKIEPYKIHILSNWLYNSDTGRWFIYPDEKLPLPLRETKKIENIEINVTYDEIDESSIDKDKSINLYFNIEIKTNKENYQECIDYSLMKTDFKKFFNEIKTKNYAKLIIEEVSKSKWFVWALDNDTIRFQIQDWESKKNHIDFAIDVEIEKNIFLEIMNKFEKELDTKEQLCIKEIKNYQDENNSIYCS